MKIKLTNEQEVVRLIFKDFLSEYNSRNISHKINMSHPGAFKLLKKMEQKAIVISRKVGKANIYSLNFNNPLLIKEIETILTIEAQNNLRWLEEFKEIKDKVKFALLYGSILRNPDSAKDIDLLIVGEKSNYNKIKKIIDNRNQLTTKPIHLLFQTPKNFHFDLERKYKVTIEIIKTGIILFGQEEFTKVLAK